MGADDGGYEVGRSAWEGVVYGRSVAVGEDDTAEEMGRRSSLRLREAAGREEGLRMEVIEDIGRILRDIAIVGRS